MARKQRSSPEDLAAELAKPSFTPGRNDVPGLVGLVVDGAEPAAARAAKALAGLGVAHASAITSALATADEAARVRLIAVLGQLARAADGAIVIPTIVDLTRDPSTRARRAAASALGKIGGDLARAALLARWDAGDASIDEQRVLAEALGKVGGDEALARLRAMPRSNASSTTSTRSPSDAAASTATGVAGTDPELVRRRDRALLMAERSARRHETSDIATDVVPPSPLVVRLGTRAGISALLVEELASIGIAAKPVIDRGSSDRVVELGLATPWSTMFASRLWATAAIRLPIAIPRSQPSTRRARDKDDAERVADPEGLATAIVQAIVAPETRALLAAWTRGPIRWRLGFASGHKRSIVWRVARDVGQRAPELVNDPTATTWDFLVDDDAGTLDLVPRRIADPRFAWRVADVPASSHPTVAAALVWLAGARDTDRVWDPFCGAGAELVERTYRGPVASLLGTDLDATALDAARANFDALRARLHEVRAAMDATRGHLETLGAPGAIEAPLAELERVTSRLDATFAVGDARTYDPGPVDLIVTNPPLGSRVHVDAAALLCECLPNFVRRLAPKGRLVWITPSARRTTPAAEAAGLVRTRSLFVDLGGVRGQLERWEPR